MLLFAAFFATCWACKRSKNSRRTAENSRRCRQETRLRIQEFLEEACAREEGGGEPPSYTVAVAKVGDFCAAPPPDYETVTAQQ